MTVINKERHGRIQSAEREKQRETSQTSTINRIRQKSRRKEAKPITERVKSAA